MALKMILNDVETINAVEKKLFIFSSVSQVSEFSFVLHYPNGDEERVIYAQAPRQRFYPPEAIGLDSSQPTTYCTPDLTAGQKLRRTRELVIILNKLNDMGYRSSAVATTSFLAGCLHFLEFDQVIRVSTQKNPEKTANPLPF